MTRSLVHSFSEQLEYSVKLSDEPAWIDFYRRLFPDMVACVRIEQDGAHQRWGIDRKILLRDGREISVDEKKRSEDYGDILLEEWSVAIPTDDGGFEYKKVGWALDSTKLCDYIAYAVPKAGRCYFLPFDLLRLTFKHNLKQFKEKAKGQYPKVARNRGYVTINVPVHWHDLKLALWQQMHREFGSGKSLPLPVKNGVQLDIFHHIRW